MLEQSPLYGVPLEEIVRACGVHPDTARRWKRQGAAPESALRLIRALWSFDLGALGEPWAGWTLAREDLISPEGDRFTPALVRSGAYYRELAREQARELKRPRQLLL